MERVVHYRIHRWQVRMVAWNEVKPSSIKSMEKGFGWMNQCFKVRGVCCKVRLDSYITSSDNHVPTQGSNNEGEVRVSWRECRKTWPLWAKFEQLVCALLDRLQVRPSVRMIIVISLVFNTGQGLNIGVSVLAPWPQEICLVLQLCNIAWLGAHKKFLKV